jgi:hypothetical protein
VNGVFPAEFAIFIHFETIGIILLILDRIVIPLLAFGAGYRNLHSHDLNPLPLLQSKTRVDSPNSAFYRYFGANCLTFRIPCKERSNRISRISDRVNRFLM